MPSEWNLQKPNPEERIPMTSIPIPDVLTIFYVLVDDWYLACGQELLKGKVGIKPTISDSEMIP
jgi:hypothetical protein